MERVADFLKGVAGVAGLLLFLGFGMSSHTSAPKNAVVLVSEVTKEYHAPPCVADLGTFQRMTIGDARALRYKPNSECRDADGFVQETRSASGSMLEWIGILGPLPSRWNEDGSWNW